MTNKCIYRYVNVRYCIINSVAPYMFRSPIVAIPREVFFEEYMTQKVKNSLIFKYKMLSF